MEGYEVKQIKNLQQTDLNHLIQESKEEGFRFLERLVEEYKDGTNTFQNPGEAIYGVFNKDDVIIAIGGLSRDPFSNLPKVGRVRRFFVANKDRRKGIGKLLLNRIMEDAKKEFTILVLHTDTDQASKFYISMGFSKDNHYPKSTHSFRVH